jgi:hypothetical protein
MTPIISLDIISPAIENMLGYNVEKYFPMLIFDIVNPDDRYIPTSKITNDTNDKTN